MSKNVNAGIETNTGIEFQKHCVLYMILDDYTKYSIDNYFVILEHHEDIVVGFNNDGGELAQVHAYQAKKSTSKWSISGLYEIVFKLVDSALSIVADPISKSSDFCVNEYFVTNNTIELKTKEDKKVYTQIVNEASELVSYSSLDQPIKDKIENKIKADYSATDNHIVHLNNLAFCFFDLPRKSKSQKEMLVGKIKTVFGERIEYHEAAFMTIMSFLSKCDKAYNQGNQAFLDDSKKRIESSEIIEAFNILCTQTKAYNLWRSKQDQIAQALSISLIDRQEFKLHYQNSFDKFKDLKEVEHQKIFNYVYSEKVNFSGFTNEQDCLRYLSTNILKNISTTLLPLHINAAVYAAFVEITES